MSVDRNLGSPLASEGAMLLNAFPDSVREYKRLFKKYTA